MTARETALAALALIGLVGPSPANDTTPPPGSTDNHHYIQRRMAEDYPLRGNLAYRLHLPFGQVQPSSNLAPWYMWWPADANETLKQHDFQSSPYPAWPATPPQAVNAPRPQGPVTFAPPQQYQPNPFQPVSYPRTQVPSYWYGR